jgi:hypothetical protein
MLSGIPDDFQKILEGIRVRELEAVETIKGLSSFLIQQLVDEE